VRRNEGEQKGMNRDDASKFQVGDRVYSPNFGEGIITGIDESNTYVYPIKVEWTGTVPQYHQRHDCFTLDGLYTVATPDPEFDIVPLEAIKVSERGVRIREGEQE
jgi:hypothetical protein